MHKAFEDGNSNYVLWRNSEQREQGVTMDFIRQQVKVGFQGIMAEQAKEAVIAYEPIWAIGTGKTATTEQGRRKYAKRFVNVLQKFTMKQLQKQSVFSTAVL